MYEELCKMPDPPNSGRIITTLIVYSHTTEDEGGDEDAQMVRD